MGRARWMNEAEDLTATPEKSVNYLTVGQLSDAIGLAPGTITDSITRGAITTNVPRSAICRPAARIGDVPLWGKDQAAKFNEMVAQSVARANDDSTTKLELVTIMEARKRNLHSLVEYAEMFSVHDQTLRRAQSHDGTFPHAVARRSNFGPGVPEHLFELAPMVEWARNKGYALPETLQATS